MSNVVFSGHQPNFIPYMGFFYKLHKSDVFVLDDDVQFSNCEYHNTNYLKIQGKKHKITVPVSYEFGDKINEVRICYEREWIRKLLMTIEMSYRKAKHFEEGYEFISRHLNERKEMLSDLNIGMIKEIADRFGIDTKIVIASKDVPTWLTNNARNVYQCVTLNGNIYYSGLGGKNYNDEQMYEDNGIKLVYTDYKTVRYEQCPNFGFIENLSVLDYIFNAGFVLPEEWKVAK